MGPVSHLVGTTPVSFPDQKSFDTWTEHLAFATKKMCMDNSLSFLTLPVRPAFTKNRLVFGQPLETLIQREGVLVPRLLVSCFSFIMEHGILSFSSFHSSGPSVQGVLRLSGSVSEIEGLTEQIDTGNQSRWFN